jgi:predicted PurR-regulated permease PerM
MTQQAVTQQTASVTNPLETFLQIGLAALLIIGCLLILRPFIPLVMWGIIIAIASYPAFLKLEKAMGGRRAWAATLWTILLLLVLIVPLLLLADTLVESARPIVTKLRNEGLVIPPPPAGVAEWPVIGRHVSRIWQGASTNVSDTLMKFAPQIKSAIPEILAMFANLGITVVQFLLAILLAGGLLWNAEAASRATTLLCNRLFGEQGPEFRQLIGATVRSVTFGVLGVALIQTAFAAVGFLVAGLPGAGVWTVIFLLGAVLQVGGLVIIPAVIYGFAVFSTTKAVIFLIWCLFVGLMDNVLKPILLGRGSSVPIIVVFLGVIGGFVAMGGVGLFVGAIILSVGYKLFQAWVHGRPVEAAEG